MKKTFLIALAGMMMFAFTQCGGGDADVKTQITQMTEKVKGAKTCDDLTKLTEQANKLAQTKVDANMKDDEKKALEEAINNLTSALADQTTKLCGDQAAAK